MRKPEPTSKSISTDSSVEIVRRERRSFQRAFSKLIPYAPHILFAATFIIYYFSNSLSGSYYDYTFRIAQALLSGRLGLTERPPEWLVEMVPLDGRYYSVFPLGSV